jgi:hypothetical protein
MSRLRIFPDGDLGIALVKTIPPASCLCGESFFAMKSIIVCTVTPPLDGTMCP